MTHFTGVSDLDGTAAPGWNRAGFFAGPAENTASDNSDTLRTFNALRRHQKQAIKAAESEAKHARADSFLRTLQSNIQDWFHARRTETTWKRDRQLRVTNRVEPANFAAVSDTPFVQRSFEPATTLAPELTAPTADEPVYRAAVADAPAPVVEPEDAPEILALPPLGGSQSHSEILLRAAPEEATQRLERLFGRLRRDDTDIAAPAPQPLDAPQSLEMTVPVARVMQDEPLTESNFAPLDTAPGALDVTEDAPAALVTPVTVLVTPAIQRTAEPELVSAVTLEKPEIEPVAPSAVAEASIIAPLPANVEQGRDWIRPAVASATTEFVKPPPLAYRASAAQPPLTKSVAASSERKTAGFSLSDTVYAVANSAMRFVRSSSSKRAGARNTPRNGDPSFLGLQKRSDIIGAVNPIDTLYGFIRSMLHERKTGLVLHVVSATHGEGTTTIARALAERATTVGHRRALLIGMNTVPGITETSEGLLSCIARGDSVESAIYEAPGSSLATASLLGATEPKNIDTKAVKEAYQACRDLYELCIVDCPPIADGTYFDLVPEEADGIIFIVQAEKLRPAVIQRVKDMLEQQGGTILGVVLNQTKHYIPKVIYKLL